MSDINQQNQGDSPKRKRRMFVEEEPETEFKQPIVNKINARYSQKIRIEKRKMDSLKRSIRTLIWSNILVISIQLLAAFKTDLPYNYFVALKLLTFSVSSTCGIWFMFFNNQKTGVLFLSIAILFNPILSFHFPKSTWVYINVGVVMFLIPNLIILVIKARKLRIEMQHALNAYKFILQIAPNIGYGSVDGYLTTIEVVMREISEYQSLLQSKIREEIKEIFLLDGVISK